MHRIVAVCVCLVLFVLWFAGCQEENAYTPTGEFYMKTSPSRGYGGVAEVISLEAEHKTYEGTGDITLAMTVGLGHLPSKGSHSNDKQETFYVLYKIIASPWQADKESAWEKKVEYTDSWYDSKYDSTEQVNRPFLIFPHYGEFYPLYKENVDIVFPVMHGKNGEDGTIQGLLDMADIPYVGCTTMASSLTMDKEKTKQVLEAAGIPVVPYICMKRCDLNDSHRYDEIFQRCIDDLGFPLFIKPCCAGSSNGANKAKTPKELSFYLMEAFSWDDKVLIEKAINAREVECSVTGNSTTANPNNADEVVKAYIPGEIVPTHTFYDFDAKYNDPNGAALRIPADLSTDLIETIRSTAVKTFKTLDCSGLSRVDFFIDKDTNAIYLNEVNTLPGFTPISMFPKMCEKAGLEFEKLTELLINEALLRFESKSQLITAR